ncbi:MAG: DUF547 domain-containing protein, partial [bacterium]
MHRASISCPPLRPEAYTGPALEAQLTEQWHLWLGPAGAGAVWGPGVDQWRLAPAFATFGPD